MSKSIKKSITSSENLIRMISNSEHFVCLYWVDGNLHLTKKNNTDDVLLISTFLAHDDTLTMEIFNAIKEIKKLPKSRNLD
jgi:hypothetical protein